MLEELDYTSVMKPVFSLDRLATTDLTPTIIGASDLTNCACFWFMPSSSPEKTWNPSLLLVEVKCTDVLNCQWGDAAPSPCYPSPCSVSRPLEQGSPSSCAILKAGRWSVPPTLLPEGGKRVPFHGLQPPLLPLRMSRLGDFVWGEWVAGGCPWDPG